MVAEAEEKLIAISFSTNTTTQEMKINNLRKLAVAVAACLIVPFSLNAAYPPKVGDQAADFTLKTLDDKAVQFSDLTAKSEVVLVVLRGWPGYQCPLCTSQVHDFVSNAEKLRDAGVQVLMVYPGPADELKAHATEFLADKNWPKGFMLVIDPDYSFTKSYGLRWNAPNETAYPSTFIVSKEGKVLFAHVSKQHGGRTKASDVLKELKPMPKY
jgi:thioredoxin-dependent peroxiredoxin